MARVAKAKETDLTRDVVLSILKAKGEASQSEIRKELEIRGRKVSNTRVGAILKKLASNNLAAKVGYGPGCNWVTVPT